MEWSGQQDGALRAADKWFRNDSRSQQVFRLFGVAGTGKSTLAIHLGQNIDGRVEFAAPTGKSAYVMGQKGCPDPRTIHSLIYLPRSKSKEGVRAMEQELASLGTQLEREKKNLSEDDRTNLLNRCHRITEALGEERDNSARPYFVLNPMSELRHAKLLVVDEASMIDNRVGEHMLSFGIPVLVIMDPAQLPPVGSAGFFDTDKPDVMLTEIHRQARDNPIIRMATMVRENGRLPLGDYGDSRVTDRRIPRDEVRAADQILVGKNVTRIKTNGRMRRLLGHEGELPVPGDRLVCLKNDRELGLLNGSLWLTQACEEPRHTRDLALPGDTILLTLQSDDEPDNVINVLAALDPFKPQVGDTHNVVRQRRAWERNCVAEFSYGYALTVHKAQGSQWNDVLLCDQSHVFRADRHRWLYTGITRAAERITVYRPSEGF